MSTVWSGSGSESEKDTKRKNRSISMTADGHVGARPFRLLALSSVLVLLGSLILPLQAVTNAVGGTRTLLTVVILMLATATLVAHTIRAAFAALLACTAGGIGFGYYLTVTGVGVGAVFETTDQFVSDTVALATGLPILGMLEAGIWTLAFAPAPVFLTWYLALRRRYVLSVIPGGAALLFLILTGDATGPIALVGSLGAIGAVGFGELEARGATIAQADVLALVFAVTIVCSMTVALVPIGTDGAGTGPDIFGAGDRETSLEGSLISAPDRSAIHGSIELSPEVRFTVQSEQESLWRTGTYDRFTGDEWVRTGEENAYTGPIDGPPGESWGVGQTVTAETRMDAMPTAPQPVGVDSETAGNTLVTAHGQFQPDSPIEAGESYTVESQTLIDNPGLFRTAGTDYPDHIEARYLQTPEDTSTEFERYTSDLVEDEDNPYDKAAAIESYLQESKSYSLEVERPDGNVAEAFLFEMDAGYCVYFATTMVQMLRSEEIPARYVVGYTSGQQVDQDEWVVRGMNAHAWVEIYVPDQGWVTFDPTPGDPRDGDRADRLEDARESGDEDADTDESADIGVERPAEEDGDEGDEAEGDETDSEGDETEAGDETPTDDDTEQTEMGNDSLEGMGSDAEGGGGGEAGDGDGVPVPVPSTENAAFGLAVLVGLVAGAHRSGLPRRLRREATLYWHGPREDPLTDTKRAGDRLEELLAKQYRPREVTETRRQYLVAVSAAETEGRGLDPRVETVAQTYERAVYAGGVSRAEADSAVAAVDELARERVRRRLPIIRQLRR